MIRGRGTGPIAALAGILAGLPALAGEADTGRGVVFEAAAQSAESIRAADDAPFFVAVALAVVLALAGMLLAGRRTAKAARTLAAVERRVAQAEARQEDADAR